MSQVWREYGAIAILLVIAVGGYLFLSRSEEDLIARAMDTMSAHILALLPEGQESDRALARLAEFERRAADGEIPAEQIEWLAASVLNLRSADASLAPEEAEMMVSLAMDEEPLLPAPATGPSGAPISPRTPVRKPAKNELLASAERVQQMFTVLGEVRSKRSADTTLWGTAPVRFYTDRGLRAVVDERLRHELESDQKLDHVRRERWLAWQARLAESVEAESERKAQMAWDLNQVSEAVRDSLSAEAAQLSRLATMRSLESRGFVFQPRVESLAVDLEGKLKSRLAGGSYNITIGEDGQLRVRSGTATGAGTAVAGSRAAAVSGSSN